MHNVYNWQQHHSYKLTSHAPLDGNGNGLILVNAALISQYTYV